MNNNDENAHYTIQIFDIFQTMKRDTKIGDFARPASLILSRYSVSGAS